MINPWMAETQGSDVTPALESYSSLAAVAPQSPPRVCCRLTFQRHASPLLAYPATGMPDQHAKGIKGQEAIDTQRAPSA